jgi:DNA-binding CsgD family transcriptional regulator
LQKAPIGSEPSSLGELEKGVGDGVERDQPRYEPRARKSAPGTWTKERITAALRDWFDAVGETPLSYEWAPRSAELLGLPMAGAVRWMRAYPRWPSTATVVRQFGSWASAIRAANLPPARAIAPGRGLAERVRSAQRLSAAGRGTAEIAAVLDVSPRTVRSYLRAGPCRDCGGPAVTAERCPRCAAVRANPPHWKRAEVIQALRAWAKQEGVAPTSADWTPTADATRKWGREYPRWPSYVTVTTLFGGWNEALAAAGLRPRRRRWRRDAIIAALREYAASHGHPPRPDDLNRDGRLPAPGTVRAHFGSLQAALDAAKLPVRRRRWNHDLIIDAFLRFDLEHGRLPTSRDWSRSSAAHPHATTVLQTFGSWSAAIEEVSGRSVSISRPKARPSSASRGATSSSRAG